MANNKEKTKNKEKKDNAFRSLLKNKSVRISIVLSLIILIAGILIFSTVMIYLYAFPKNPRLILREIVVESAGWWNNRTENIIKLLKLKPGKTNLFELNLKELRLKLKKQPGIEDVTFERALPDTLRIRIMERIPRAFLGSAKSPYLIDSSCVVISKKYCFGLKAKSLPVIIGIPPEIKKKLANGIFVREFLPAVRLIMLTKTDFPEFKVPAISIKEGNRLVFVLYYKNYTKKPYTVRMPDKNIRYFLKLLKKAIIQAISTHNTKRNINLSFQGNIVFGDR